jgi:hypothetical protein
MSNSLSRQLADLLGLMKGSASEFIEAQTRAGDELARVWAGCGVRVNLLAQYLETIINEHGLAPKQSQREIEGEDTIAPLSAGESVPDLLAARFCEVLVREARAHDVGLMSLIHPWRKQPPLVREVLTLVVSQLITDAREERETWTREYIAGEVERMRAAILKGPSGQLVSIRDLADVPRDEALKMAQESVERARAQEPRSRTKRIMRVGCRGDDWHGLLVEIVNEEEEGRGYRVKLAADSTGDYGFRTFPRTVLDEPETFAEHDEDTPSKALRLSVEDEEANRAVRFAGASAIPTGKARDEARDAVGTPKDWRPKGGES